MERIGLFLLALLLIIVPVAWADYSDEKTIAGTVVSIDPVGYLLIVRYVDPETGGSDEINLRATSESDITRGTQSIEFTDIQRDDQVEVTYYGDNLSGLKIKDLVDSTSPNDKNKFSPYSTIPYGTT